MAGLKTKFVESASSGNWDVGDLAFWTEEGLNELRQSIGGVQAQVGNALRDMRKQVDRTVSDLPSTQQLHQLLAELSSRPALPDSRPMQPQVQPVSCLDQLCHPAFTLVDDRSGHGYPCHGCSYSSLAISTEHRKCFVLRAPHVALESLQDKRGKQLTMAAAALINDKLHLTGEDTICVVDAFPLRRTNDMARYFIRVASLSEAGAIVHNRRLLKGSGMVLLDHLTPEEKAVHDALWPSYVAAWRAGYHAQFHRARLYVWRYSATLRARVRYEIKL